MRFVKSKFIHGSPTAIARRFANGPMIAVVTQAATPHLGSHSGVSFAMEVPSWLMPSFPKLTNTFN